MTVVKSTLRYITWPLLFFGMGGLVIALASTGAGVTTLLVVLAAAVLFSFAVERIIPYQPAWNRDAGDSRRDWLHALVNLTLNRSMLWLLPWFAWMAAGGGVWPNDWPFWLQVVLAVLLLDVGIAIAHHASHRFALLWRFHAVHHSVRRMYGFNGLMKHPLHQALETVSGVLPLLLLGIPADVALTLPFVVALALLGQHSNADIRTGPLKHLFANAEVHRFHHVNTADGNVNFGLFTTLYDHLAGTFHFLPGRAPRHSEALGIGERPNYPQGYLQQLLEPFRGSRLSSAETDAARGN